MANTMVIKSTGETVLFQFSVFAQVEYASFVFPARLTYFKFFFHFTGNLILSNSFRFIFSQNASIQRYSTFQVSTYANVNFFFENSRSSYGFENDFSIATFWCITLVISMHQSRDSVNDLFKQGASYREIINTIVIRVVDFIPKIFI